ncbi:HTH_Tnp_Tc3_2 domain-containing protein [Trichonephila clavipes]|uniref:HTH_Tnp_Tc3_2 domain-containing protein n=1 Tax=Trichonephila clavipes TaxID=2585209 RepID=A0A8X6SXJ5_TRICX|nr:HTH_Tnp_Tc3_2 domain-containing protein [Trichonephila clavipes]
MAYRPSDSPTLMDVAERPLQDDATRWQGVGRQSEAICCWNLWGLRNVLPTLWKQFIEAGTVVHRPGEGHKRATTRAEDRYVRLLAERYRSVTAIQLPHNLYNAIEISFSRITVTQRLNAGGLMLWAGIVAYRTFMRLIKKKGTLTNQ